MIFTRRFGSLRARENFSGTPVMDIAEYEAMVAAEAQPEKVDAPARQRPQTGKKTSGHDQPHAA